MNFAVLIKAQVEQGYEYVDYIYINIPYRTFYIYILMKLFRCKLIMHKINLGPLCLVGGKQARNSLN